MKSMRAHAACRGQPCRPYEFHLTVAGMTQDHDQLDGPLKDHRT